MACASGGHSMPLAPARCSPCTQHRPKPAVQPEERLASVDLTREDYRHFVLSLCILRPLFATPERIRSTCIGFFFFGHFFVWEIE